MIHPVAHERGQVRLPYDSGGEKAGTVVPALRCLRCSGVELSEMRLEAGHAGGRCDTRDKWIPPWNRLLDAAWRPHPGAQGDLLAELAEASS